MAVLDASELDGASPELELLRAVIAQANGSPGKQPVPSLDPGLCEARRELDDDCRSNGVGAAALQKLSRARVGGSDDLESLQTLAGAESPQPADHGPGHRGVVEGGRNDEERNAQAEPVGGDGPDLGRAEPANVFSAHEAEEPRSLHLGPRADVAPALQGERGQEADQQRKALVYLEARELGEAVAMDHGRPPPFGWAHSMHCSAIARLTSIKPARGRTPSTTETIASGRLAPRPLAAPRFAIALTASAACAQSAPVAAAHSLVSREEGI